ncbi:unnamed protein product [Calypogeia fissa]
MARIKSQLVQARASFYKAGGHSAEKPHVVLPIVVEKPNVVINLDEEPNLVVPVVEKPIGVLPVFNKRRLRPMKQNVCMKEPDSDFSDVEGPPKNKKRVPPREVKKPNVCLKEVDSDFESHLEAPPKNKKRVPPRAVKKQNVCLKEPDNDFSDAEAPPKNKKRVPPRVVKKARYHSEKDAKSPVTPPNMAKDVSDHDSPQAVHVELGPRQKTSTCGCYRASMEKKAITKFEENSVRHPCPVLLKMPSLVRILEFTY